MATYLRYPHIHGDLVAFVAADDLWLAPIAGGRAWRLTDDKQPIRSPRFSPDGEHVAFVSFRNGQPEVFVVATGGDESPRRLTWWGAKNTLVLGWTGDGRVLAASHAGEKNLRDLVVKSVGLDGAVERLSYGPSWGVALREDGATALVTPGSRPPAWWKRYRGGSAPRLWLDRAGTGEWERLLGEEPASLVDPMWLGDRLAFVSDRAASLPGSRDQASAQANLWIFDDLDGEARQVTDQGPGEGYVRDASTDGRRVVWHSRGTIWLLDGVDADPTPLDITVPGGSPEPFLAKATRNLVRISPDHGGDASLVGWRGNVFWLTHREGPARGLLVDSRIRAREPVVLGQSGYGAFVTDADGEDSLEIQHLLGESETRRIGAGKLGRVLHLAADPAGERVAVITHDGRILLVDLADGAKKPVREVAHSPRGEATSPSFSPDGRYLLWSQPTATGAELHHLMILDTSAKRDAVALTSGTFHDHDPAFSFDGKHVVFLSERTFDPTYDSHEFALSFGGTTRPWLIPISATEPPPFGPSAEGWRISDPPKEERGEDEEGEGAPVSPDLDAEGAEDRAVPFPVRSGDYRRLATCRAGVLWIEEAGETGALGSRRAGVKGDPTPDRLQLWSFSKRAVETVADKVSFYAVSGDGTKLVVRHKDTVTVSPADQKPKEDDPSLVRVDLSRLRFEVSPRVEWAQMFDENARLMRDHFWREDMDGVDWAEVVDRWRPVVETLGSHDDLVDLLWETVGELNTSHAYVIPTDPPGDKGRRIGLLGADLSPARKGWRIDRILPGESSDPEARSPLRAAGVDARVGDLIVAVDGAPVDLAFGPNTRLMGAAGKPVELVLRRKGKNRRVVVVPLDDEEVLRYQDWVRSRRAYVTEHSGGRLGYVHVPDMMGSGWAQLHRDLRHASRREGLIVDVRYNRGGHTSQLVLARLTKELVGWTVGRHYAEPASYPDAAPRGPVVLVANEYSGSDGDIINAASQAVGIGPVVGVRTWGGVVGIDGRFDLVDGTSVTQPRYAFWLQGKDWGVENHGVDPDIEVIHSPADYFSDADPQLDRAMEEALRQLEERPAAKPPTMPAPKVG
ncbi:MAG TPA: S41 family peptidase [Acidimicrobiia bacterium]|nr:S41 family peptidase [Acidimicrobiia bacterium]